jgi:TolB protein
MTPRRARLGRIAALMLGLTVGAVPASAATASKSQLPQALIAVGLGSGRNFDIWLVNADGRRVKRLTSEPAVDTAPTWSPDGTRVAYLRAFGDSSMNVDGMGGGLGAIDMGPAGHARNSGGTLSVVGADGSGDHVLLKTADAAAPAWSPDGSRLAFARTRMGIYVVGADGRGLRRLTDGGDYPAWSPDGSRIAYAGEAGIWVMNADGAGKRRLSTDSFDLGPSWSPDGTVIAFTRFTDNGREVWVVNADGTGSRRLATSTGGVIDPNITMDPAPSWSPDGAKLAFDVAGRTGVSSIGVIDSDGSGLHIYKHNHDGDFHPTWSPDGSTLLTTSWLVKGEGIGVLPVSAAGPPRIVVAGFNNTPAWQPTS